MENFDTSTGSLNSQSQKIRGLSLLTVTMLAASLSSNLSYVDMKSTLDKSLYNAFSISTACETRQVEYAAKPSIKERYARMSKSEWFRKAYHDRSLGEVMEIEGA